MSLKLNILTLNERVFGKAVYSLLSELELKRLDDDNANQSDKLPDLGKIKRISKAKPIIVSGIGSKVFNILPYIKNTAPHDIDTDRLKIQDLVFEMNTGFFLFYLKSKDGKILATYDQSIEDDDNKGIRVLLFKCLMPGKVIDSDKEERLINKEIRTDNLSNDDDAEDMENIDTDDGKDKFQISDPGDVIALKLSPNELDKIHTSIKNHNPATIKNIESLTKNKGKQKEEDEKYVYVSNSLTPAICKTLSKKVKMLF